MTQRDVLHQYMSRMDKLWKRYDNAVDKIPNNDAFAFKRYAEHLDDFFIYYWDVFEGAVRDVRVDELVRLADEKFDESQRKLLSAWTNTTDALHRRSTELIKERSKARALPQLLLIFRRAERLLSDIRKEVTIEARIKGHTEAADVLEEFVRKLEVTD